MTLFIFISSIMSSIMDQNTIEFLFMYNCIVEEIDDYDETCEMCNDENDDDQMIKLPTEHIMHKQCYLNFLKNQTEFVCPFTNENIEPDNKELLLQLFNESKKLLDDDEDLDTDKYDEETITIIMDTYETYNSDEYQESICNKKQNTKKQSSNKSSKSTISTTCTITETFQEKLLKKEKDLIEKVHNKEINNTEKELEKITSQLQKLKNKENELKTKEIELKEKLNKIKNTKLTAENLEVSSLIEKLRKKEIDMENKRQEKAQEKAIEKAERERKKQEEKDEKQRIKDIKNEELKESRELLKEQKRLQNALKKPNAANSKSSIRTGTKI